MPKSDSSSSTSSSSSTTSQTTTAETTAGSGIAVGPSAQISYQQQFGPDVAAAFNNVISLAEGAGQVIVDANAKLVQVAEAAINKTASVALNNPTPDSTPTVQTGQQVTNSNIVMYLVIGAIAVLGLSLMTKGKK